MKYYYVVRARYADENESEELCTMNDFTSTDIFSDDAVVFNDRDLAVNAMNIVLENAVAFNKAVIDGRDDDWVNYHWDDEDYGMICERLEVRTAVTFDISYDLTSDNV